MTIGERIKSLRKDLKLTQAKFGERISVKGSAIGLYESGDRNVTDRVIAQVSQAFHVREEWLRTGEEPRDLPRLSALLSDVNMDDDEIAILQMYMELPHERRRILIDYILALADEIRSKRDPSVSSSGMASLSTADKIENPPAHMAQEDEPENGGELPQEVLQKIDEDTALYHKRLVLEEKRKHLALLEAEAARSEN